MSECPICKAPEIEHNPNQLEQCRLKAEVAALTTAKEKAEVVCVDLNSLRLSLLNLYHTKAKHEGSVEKCWHSVCEMETKRIIPDGTAILDRLAAAEKLAEAVDGSFGYLQGIIHGCSLQPSISLDLKTEQEWYEPWGATMRGTKIVLKNLKEALAAFAATKEPYVKS